MSAHDLQLRYNRDIRILTPGAGDFDRGAQTCQPAA
jgi:hypothetical protein